MSVNPRTNRPIEAFIGLGSNIGHGPERLRTAISSIDRLAKTRVRRRSSFYRSLPMGTVSQRHFTNAVVEIETRMPPLELLSALQRIERRQGRIRTLRWGPRTLDLDILTYGDMVLGRSELTIPHPGIPVRPFVLYPLMEIAPRIEIPGIGTPAALIRRAAGGAPRPVLETRI